jgi:hypothetical protein
MVFISYVVVSRKTLAVLLVKGVTASTLFAMSKLAAFAVSLHMVALESSLMMKGQNLSKV